MSQHVLITGGAGFIGSHLADELLRHGYRVRVLDSLLPQVHGPEAARPDHLEDEVELVVGDVRNPDTVCRALKEVDAVFHLAASVGVGQSMYEISAYTSANCGGTGNLLQVLIDKPVERLIVASSMSIYGEGLYRTIDGGEEHHAGRPRQSLHAGIWELRIPGAIPCSRFPPRRKKSPSLSSVYTLSKFYQEQMCLQVGQAYHIPTVALRLFMCSASGRSSPIPTPGCWPSLPPAT